MGIAISMLKPDDPRIRKVMGSCGCVIKTTTSRYPQIQKGEKVYLDCLECGASVRVYPYQYEGTRYCSSKECKAPHAPLSRYNTDPDGRCSPCQERERAEWLEKLRNPPKSPRELLRQTLAEQGELTAVQLERATGIAVAQVYKHLVDLVRQQEVTKLRPSKALATYRLAEQNEQVAA